MNDLLNYFWNNKGYMIHKFPHFLEVYDHYFSKYRGTDAVIMEIGIAHGGSVEMWRNYFGDKAKIIGVDVAERSFLKKDINFEFELGDQSDEDFLKYLKDKYPRIDVLIDDGGHEMYQQIATFEHMFSHVSENGIYACEDLHTSYRKTHGGGYKSDKSFIEYSKNFIDYLHSSEDGVPINNFYKQGFGVHFYPSLLLIEKRNASAFGGATMTGEKAV